MKKGKRIMSILSLLIALIMLFNISALAIENVNSPENSEKSEQETTNEIQLNYPDKVENTITSQPKADDNLRLPEVSANQPDENIGKLIEKEKYYKTYKTKNGTYKTVYSGVPNYYESFFGAKKDYDNNLVLQDKLIGQDYYKASSSDIDVKLPTEIKEDKGISFEYNNVKVDMIPLGGDYSKSAVLNNAILYNNVYDGIDVQYTLNELGLREDIILNKYVDVSSFSYELNTHGDKAVLEDGIVNIYKDNNKTPSYSITAPAMTDANNEMSIDVKLSLTEKDGKTILTVTPSHDWIAAPERAFPVKIDPDVIKTDINQLKVGSFTERNNELYSQLAYGYAGYLLGDDIGIPGANLKRTRMLISVDQSFINSIPSEANITSARFNIFQYTRPDNNNTIFECQYIENDWNFGMRWSDTLKLQTKPSSETGEYASSSRNDAWHSFDIMASVTHWLEGGPSSQHGLMVKAQDDKNKGAAFFTDSSYGGQGGTYNGTQAPNIVIEYSIDNPVPPGLSVNNIGINLRPINVARRDGTLQFLGMFADGLTAPTATVNYALNDSSKGQNGSTRASYSYKYPTTAAINDSLPADAKKYNNHYVSNWQTGSVFNNFDFNTLYHYSANANLNGTTGPTNNSSTFLVYQIKQYDNFTKIANYYGVDVFKLRAENRAQDGLLIANNTIVVINPTRNGNKPYNPAPLSNADKEKIDSILMGRGLHCEFGFEPVNLNTGNFYMNQSDCKINDLNGPFEIARTYNSKGAGNNSLFGRGWSFDYDENLTKLEDGKIVYSKGDGSSMQFTPNSDGTYSSPEGYYLSLSKINKGTDSYVVDDETITFDVFEYEIKDNNGTVKHFNRYGLLDRVTDKKGFVTTINYDRNYNISSIISPAGAKYEIGYTHQGFIGSVKLPSGGVLSYTYDNDNNLTSYTDANGNTTSYTYNANHEMTKWSDANGVAVNTNEYDAQGRVVKQIDANGKVTAFAYGDNTTTTTDANGNKTVYTYDSMFRTTRIDYADGTFETKNYDDNNNLASATNCAGKTTSYTYDSKGNVIKETRFDGETKTYEYNSDNNITKEKDFDGKVTKYEYNSNGDLVTKIDNAENTWKYEYDNQHRLVKQTDANGGETAYTYTGAFVSSKTDALGNKTQYYYNALGQVTSEVDANGNIKRYTYDNGGRKTQEQAPNGGVTKYEYDKAGNVTSITDAKGYKFTFGYDGVGNMLWSCDSLGHIITYTYDGLNKKTSETDPLGNKTTFAYDCKARIIAKTDGLGNKTCYEYDAIGNLVKITDPKGNVTENTYDLRFNKTETTTNSLKQKISYEYDSVGNLTKITTPGGGVTEYEYDSIDRLVKSTSPVGLVTEYEYDNNSNIISTKDNADRTIKFKYDALGRNIEQIFDNGSTIKYEYDKNSNILTQTNQAGQTTTYTYDESNNKTSETDSIGRVTKYEYDLNGNLIKKTAPNGGVTSYEYNCYDLLSKEIDNNGNYTLFGYDANENLIAKTDVYGNSEIYTYDPNGQISSVTDAIGNKFTFAYDANGNNIKLIAPNNAETVMEYDSQNRLVKENKANGLVTTNTYNADGLIEITTTNSGKNDSFVYDKAGRLIERKDALGNTEKYGYDIANNLVAFTGIDGNKTSYKYDNMGNIKSSTDAEDKTTNYSYDLLGNLLSKKDAQGRKWEYKYDAVSRLTEEKDPLETITAYEYNSLDLVTKITKANIIQKTNTYDILGNLTQQTDANGNNTKFEYDALDRVIKSTAANNGVEEYLYDANSNLIMHKNPKGAITEYKYDNMGNVETKTMPNGGLFTYGYDSIGNQTYIKDPLANVTALNYDLESRLVSKTLPNGAEQTYAYDALGRITKLTNDTLSKSYKYDEFGNVASETDNSDRTTKFAYDKMHRMTSATNAKGAKTTFAYDENGNLAKEKSALGYETSYSYDALDRITKKLNPVGQVEEYQYDVLGNLQKLTKAGGRTYIYTHDNNGNVMSETNPLGQTLKFEYDSMNQLISETDYKDKATKYSYDMVGNLTSVTARNGGVTSFDYDLSGNLIIKNDAENRKTEFSYDLLNRLTHVKEDEVVTAKYGYDSVGNLTSFTNGNENTTTYAYDKLGNQTSVTDPLGNVTGLSYNKNGLLEKVTNPNKATVKYDYDELDALLTKSYDEKEQKEALYAYDLDGNCVSMADVQGKTGYEYDAIGRISAVKLANGNQKVRYFYDEYGNLQELGYPDGTSVKYYYDELNRLTSIVDRNSKTTSYTYDENGNVTRVDRPNNTYSVITYDDSDNVTSVKNIKRTKTLCGKWEESEISSFSYEYDLSGLITKEIANRNRVTKERAFVYDQKSQLVVVNEKTTLNCGKTWNIRNIEYTYDNAGNCIKENENNTLGKNRSIEYTYDKADRLTKKTINLGGTPITTDYKYDANGNLVSEKSNYKFEASASVDVDSPDFDLSFDADLKIDYTTCEKTYSYNNENRLTAVKEGGRLLMAALYDGDGERIFTLNNKSADGYTHNHEGTALSCYSDSKSGDDRIQYNTDVIKNEMLIPNGINRLTAINYELTGYINDTNREHTQVLMEFGANSDITNAYTYGINRNSASINGKENYYMYDGRGSVSQLTNSTGATVASYKYDIYGETKTTNHIINNPYKYNAEATDSVTGMQYLRARYYNPNNHRFMSKDTYQGSLESPLSRNNYAYANNNPVNYSDPTGHWIHIAIGAGIGAVVGGVIGGVSSYVSQKESGKKVSWGQVAKDAAIGGAVGAVGGAVTAAVGPALAAKLGTTTLLGVTKLSIGGKIATGALSAMVGGIYSRATCATLNNIFNPQKGKTNMLKSAFDPNAMLFDGVIGGVVGALPSLKSVLKSSKARLLKDIASKNKSNPSCNGSTPKAQSGSTQSIENNLLNNTDEIIEGGLEVPKPGSLNNFETRRWYLDQEARIPEIIDNSLPLDQQAKQAFEFRNQIRTQAREAMSDRALADELFGTRPNLTWDQVVKKYTDKGFSGDGLYQEIIKAAQRSNDAINKALNVLPK